MQTIHICSYIMLNIFVQFQNLTKNLSKVRIYVQLMEELFSAIETGSVDKVKEVIVNKAVSPTACSEVSQKC